MKTSSVPRHLMVACTINCSTFTFDVESMHMTVQNVEEVMVHSAQSGENFLLLD